MSSELGGQVARLGEHGQDLVEPGVPLGPVGPHEHGRKRRAVVQPARHRDRLPPQPRAAVVVADERAGTGEAAQHHDAQAGVALLEHTRRLGQDLERSGLDGGHAPARVLESDRRPGEQLAVADVTGDVGRGAIRDERIRAVPAAIAGHAEGELDLGSLVRVGDAQPERRSQGRHRLVERERCRRGGGRADVVVHRALGPAQRRRGSEVAGEVGQRARRGPRGGGLDRLARAQVQLGPARRRQPVVERTSHELVREAVDHRALGHGGHHAASQREVDRPEQGRLVDSRPTAEHREVELGPHHGGQLEHAGRRLVEPGQALAHHLAHSVGAAELLRGAGQPGAAVGDLERAGLDERAPELDHQERVALGEVMDGGCEDREVGAEIAARRPLDQLADLGAREAGQPERHDALGAAQVDQRGRELRRHVRLEVAKRGHEQHARVGGGAGEVAQEEQRRGVRPVRVLEHDEQRPPVRGVHQQLGHGGVEAVTLGVLIGRDRIGQRPDPGGEVGDEAGELAAAGAEVVPQLLGIGHAHEVVKRLRDRLVGDPHHGITGSVQHQHAVGRGLVGELAHEPALARPRLPAHERDPPALASGTRHQRAQERELAGPADERERRREPQRSGQLHCRVERGHSQN